MDCPLAQYKKTKGQIYLFCAKTKSICYYSKYCNEQGKYILNERWEQCILNNKKNVPNGAKEVLFERRGYLYVNIGNSTQRIKNKFNEIPNYIYIKDGVDGYEISLTPFENKKTYSKKKTEK